MAPVMRFDKFAHHGTRVGIKACTTMASMVRYKHEHPWHQLWDLISLHIMAPVLGLILAHSWHQYLDISVNTHGTMRFNKFAHHGASAGIKACTLMTLVAGYKREHPRHQWWDLISLHIMVPGLGLKLAQPWHQWSDIYKAWAPIAPVHGEI